MTSQLDIEIDSNAFDRSRLFELCLSKIIVESKMIESFVLCNDCIHISVASFVVREDEEVKFL